MSSPPIADRKLKLQVIRLPERKKHIFTDLSSAIALAQFQSMIAAQFAVDPQKQLLFVAGVPPKPLSLDDPTATLSALGIRPGDSIELRVEDGLGGADQREMQQGKAGTWDVISSIPAGSGSFVRKEMPRDNSCLFHAVGYVAAKQSTGAAAAHRMRELAANLVAADPATYSTTFLGSPNALYQDHILNPNTWGGAIELALFARQFQTEILAFDLANLREDRFGDGEGYSKRVFLLYTGDHYDALVFANGQGSEQVVFSSKDEHAWVRARDAVMSMHSELAAQGKCAKQSEWRHNKDLKRAHPASKAADLEREKRVAAEKAKTSSSSSSSAAAASGYNPTPLPAFGSSSSSAAAVASAPSPSAPAAAPAHPISPVNADDWRCEICTCANKKTARRCAACDNPNPNAAAASAVAAAPVAARPAAATPVAAAAAPSTSGYVSPPGSFSCTTCTAFNERPSARCVVCGTTQPGSAGSSSRPIELDGDDGDNVPSPIPQHTAQLIGDPDDMGSLSASAIGLTPQQRAVLAQPWACERCTMQNVAGTIVCSACRSAHPHPMLNPATAYGAAAAAGGSGGGASSAAPAPTGALGRLRSVFASQPPWVCERCGKSQSAQLYKCANCGLPNAALHHKIAEGMQQQPGQRNSNSGKLCARRAVAEHSRSLAHFLRFGCCPSSECSIM